MKPALLLAAVALLAACSPVAAIPAPTRAISQNAPREQLQEAIDLHSAEWAAEFPQIVGLYVSETDARIEIDTTTSAMTPEELMTGLREIGLGDLPAHVNVSDGTAGDG